MMEIGKRYIVTKGSDDGTFEVGDHIFLDENGDIISPEAMGWIESEDVPAATKGMEVEIDQEWIARRREYLLKELEGLK